MELVWALVTLFQEGSPNLTTTLDCYSFPGEPLASGFSQPEHSSGCNDLSIGCKIKPQHAGIVTGSIGLQASRELGLSSSHLSIKKYRLPGI